MEIFSFDGSTATILRDLRAGTPSGAMVGTASRKNAHLRTLLCGCLGHTVCLCPPPTLPPHLHPLPSLGRSLYLPLYLPFPLPSLPSQNLGGIAVHNSKLYFVGRNGTNNNIPGFEPWEWDGTANDPILIANISPDDGSSPVRSKAPCTHSHCFARILHASFAMCTLTLAALHVYCTSHAPGALHSLSLAFPAVLLHVVCR
jgi:ELWxxDGT repeat protein